MPVKRPIKGRAAKQKGSRAERKVRDILRGMYPKEQRDKIFRVPLSGGGAMKGDVQDNNDTDTSYEVKCQEKLRLPDWWRQTKSQAGASKTPVLVITQNYRPFYFIMLETDFDAMCYQSGVYYEMFKKVDFASAHSLMDNLAALSGNEVAKMEIDGDKTIIMSEGTYTDVKGWIINGNCDTIDPELEQG